jgi:hypothetical protein
MQANSVDGKPTCNRKELLTRTIEVLKERGKYIGRSRELNKEVLGTGSWNHSPNHLRRYLRDIEPDLKTNGISLDLSSTDYIGLELQQ